MKDRLFLPILLAVIVLAGVAGRIAAAVTG